MARVKIKVEEVRTGRVQIAALESNLRRGPLRQLIDAKGVRIRDEAKRLAPVSTVTPRPPRSTMPRQNPGRLKRSIYAKATTVDRLPAVEVGAKVPYLGYVLYPTAPHEIRPRTKRALAFYWTAGGGFVIARRVFHPGTAGQDFLTPALKAGGL